MTDGEIAQQAAKKASEKVPSWIERLLMPSLNEIKGELKSINTRIDSLDDRMNTRITALDGKIDSLRNETKAEIEGLRKEMLSKFESVDHKFEATDIKIDGLKTEIALRFDSLEKRIPVIEEIAELRLKIAELEKRLAMA